jgi:hypothetical protein
MISRKQNRFAEAFTDVMAITLALTEKKPEWEGNWDKLLGIL